MTPWCARPAGRSPGPTPARRRDWPTRTERHRGRRAGDAGSPTRSSTASTRWWSPRTSRRPTPAVTTIELATGAQTRARPRSPARRTGGRSATHAAYAVYRPGGSGYCLATLDLAPAAARTGSCAPPREGFTDATGSPSRRRPDDLRRLPPGSCRTLVGRRRRRDQPFRGAPECTGWDALRTENGAVWSVVPNERESSAALPRRRRRRRRARRRARPARSPGAADCGVLRPRPAEATGTPPP